MLCAFGTVRGVGGVTSHPNLHRVDDNSHERNVLRTLWGPTPVARGRRNWFFAGGKREVTM